MPNPPKTYDEITRQTVPEPDSSFRPSAEQKKQAYEGFRALDADEQALFDRVTAALSQCGEDVGQVKAEVERTRVVLRGQVPTSTALERIVDSVRGVDGVGGVDDQLVIAAP